MSDIKKLLNKKGWSGIDLGKLQLANVAHIFSQTKQGIAEPTPLISEGEFSKMFSTLKDPSQIQDYNNFLKIHKWLSIAYNIVSAQEQQAYSSYKSMFQYISVSSAVEKTYDYISKLPVIMTEKQYKDFIAKKKEEIINPKEEIKYNLFELFNEALETLVNQLQKSPRKANPLKALKKSLEKERVEDPRILSRYNEVMGEGYYVLDETGERSDQMSQEEWRKAIRNEKGYRAYEKAINTFNELEGIEEQGDFLSRKLITMFKDDIYDTNELGDYSLQKECTWHYYENPPEDLNKWEILETGDLLSYYRSLEWLDKTGKEVSGKALEKAITEDIEAFKKEFPDVFEAVLKDMSKYLKDVVKTPVKEWATTTYTPQELYKLKYYSFNEKELDNNYYFDGNKRALHNGVAILKEGYYKANVDPKGYYKSPDILAHFMPLCLNSFFTDVSDYAENVKRIEGYRRDLVSSYYYVMGFNKAIELIEEYYDLPQLEVFKFNMEFINNKIFSLNGLTALLYNEIQDNDYEDKELQEKKLEVLKNYFYPVDFEKFEIPQEKISRVKDMFADYSAFKDTNIFDLLCVVPEGADYV